MEPCAGCGFRNPVDRDTCAKCGRALREVKILLTQERVARVRKTVLGVVKLVVGLLIVAAAIFKIFGPSRLELKRRAAEERQARQEARRVPEPPPPAPAAIAAPVVAPVPESKPESRPESPARKQGLEHLHRADGFYEAGDYKGAVAAYRDAEFMGVMPEEGKRRRDAAQAVLRIVEIRDYLATESQIEPPWITAGHWNLKNMDPVQLPTDAWREEHRKTFARLESLVRETGRPGAQVVEARPPLIRDRAAFQRGFKLEFSPRKEADGKAEGVFVMWLDPEGLLAKAGLKTADLIVELNGRRLDTLDVASRIEQDREFRGVALRKGERVPFEAQLPAPK
jgi:hypothetical protein